MRALAKFKCAGWPNEMRFYTNKEKQTFAISKLSHDIENLFRFATMRFNLKIDIAGDKENTINTYYSELLQIMLVLINNAKDACIKNDINNRHIAINIQEKKDYFEITIEDNGGGINKKIINRIFEPYFTTKEATHGTGLGLHIVSTLLENSLNGTISVSNTDEGARFIILLKK